jgi:hypothetical protein
LGIVTIKNVQTPHANKLGQWIWMGAFLIVDVSMKIQKRQAEAGGAASGECEEGCPNEHMDLSSAALGRLRQNVSLKCHSLGCSHITCQCFHIPQSICAIAR